MTESKDHNVSPIMASSDGQNPLTRIVNTGAVIEELPVGVFVSSQNATGAIEVLFVNEFARNIFSITQNIDAPCALDNIWSDVNSTILKDQLREAFTTRRKSNFEWSISNGAIERHISSQLIPLLDKDGQAYQVICTLEDQTAEKMAERNLLHHAFHDALTGLPNRVLFRTKLEEAVNEFSNDPLAAGVGCAVLIINIDRFQQINESFGHSAGDRFLVSMAATLRRCIRGSDILARLSGDEFAILVKKCQDMDEVKIITDRVHEAMRMPYDIDSNEVFTSVSIGVATTFSSTTHPEDLIRDADFAMHAAKTAGKSRTEIYERDTHQRAQSQFHLETELRRAVERDELELYYQPIIDLNTCELHGFEALTRWIHKDKGFVSPAEFIPLAEETGVIVDLGKWAFETAVKQVKTWIDTYGLEKAVPVNVNVSGIQFARDDVAAMTSSILKKHNVRGDLLRIELTESAIMANPTRISQVLHDVRKQGIKVALDDFGTGYSSLNYLHQFPIDILKIDRSFIAQLQEGNQLYKILSMIGQLAGALGLEVVAEGIEDEEHQGMLRDMKFHFAQGFYFSRPLPSSEASDLHSGDLPWVKAS